MEPWWGNSTLVMNRIAEFWQGRSARERALLVSLAVPALGAVWFLAAVGPLLDWAAFHKQERDSELALLERMNRISSRMDSLPPPRPRSDTSLLLLANGSLREAGLAGYLEEGNADGERRVRLRLRAAPFARVSAWLARLAVQEGIHTVSADIEPAAASGLAQVNVVLERAD